MDFVALTTITRPHVGRAIFRATAPRTSQESHHALTPAIVRDERPVAAYWAWLMVYSSSPGLGHTFSYPSAVVRWCTRCEIEPGGKQVLVNLKHSCPSRFWNGRFSEVLNYWPAMAIVLALIITAAWTGFFIWIILRLLLLVTFHNGQAAVVPAIIALLCAGVGIRDRPAG